MANHVQCSVWSMIVMQAEAEERRERQERQEMLEKKRRKEEQQKEKEEAAKVCFHDHTYRQTQHCVSVH